MVIINWNWTMCTGLGWEGGYCPASTVAQPCFGLFILGKARTGQGVCAGGCIRKVLQMKITSHIATGISDASSTTTASLKAWQGNPPVMSYISFQHCNSPSSPPGLLGSISGCIKEILLQKMFHFPPPHVKPFPRGGKKVHQPILLLWLLLIMINGLCNFMG